MVEKYKRIALVCLALTIALVCAGMARAADTICSVDDDFNGTIDFWCPAPDADHDGYATDGSGVETGTDCDDNDMFDYVGVAVGCTVATGAKNQINPDGWKVCQSGGTYTSCTANSVTPYCPAGCLSCKYWDAASGSDSNAGTFASPYQTAAKFTSLVHSAGSCNFLKAGTYTDGQFLADDSDFGTSSNWNIFESYPGPRATISTAFRPIHFNGGYWRIANLDITNNTCRYGVASYDQACVQMSNSSEVDYTNKVGDISRLKIWHNTMHPASGGNPSSLMIHNLEAGTTVHHNLIYDMIGDAGEVASGNFIFLMRGRGYDIHHNVTLPTVGRDNLSIFNKHANYLSTYLVRDNIFTESIDGSFATIQMAGRNVTLTRNLLWGGGMRSLDPGGTAFPSDWTVEDNTVKSQYLLAWNPTYAYNSDNSPSGSVCAADWTQGPMILRDNVWVWNGVAGDGGFIVGTYGSDPQYEQTIEAGKLQLSGNVYYRGGAAWAASLFGSNNGDITCSGRGVKGAFYSSYATWQSITGDTSVVEDPLLDSFFRAESVNGVGKGWLVTVPPVSSSSSSASSSSSSSAVAGVGTNYWNRRH